MLARIRPFVHADADAVLRLYESVGEWFEDVGVNREFIISSSIRPDFRYLIAEDGGLVVGFIGALYFEAVGRAELGPVGVQENQRGAGVGAALTQAMLGFLNEAGVRRVIVKVKVSNNNAISFFLGQGFTHEALLRGYTQRGEDVVQLVREIS